MNSVANAVALHPSPSTPHFDRPTYLMCQPEWYDVDYVINPWMAGNLHRPSRDRAFAQWRALYQAVRSIADVRVLHARPGSPDMAFVAHTALVNHGLAAVSSFAHLQRQAEEQHVRAWFVESGFLIWDTPRETSFEGEGDSLFSEDGRHLWMAHGLRTCLHSHRHIEAAWGARTTSLHLTDPRFFHLDTCFAPLSTGHLLYYPGAFDGASLSKIEAHYPEDKRIAVSEAEAIQFACNLININRHIIMGQVGGALLSRLQSLGFYVTQLDLSEFLRGGGSAKSLALRISDANLISPEESRM